MAKRGMESEMIGWWILAIAVGFIMLVGFFILRGEGEGAAEIVKNMFRLRR